MIGCQQTQPSSYEWVDKLLDECGIWMQAERVVVGIEVVMSDTIRERANVEAVEPYLERNRRQNRISYVRFRSNDYAVFPGVFAPQIFEDTFFFAEHLPISPKESLLEVGAGCGLIAIDCALRGSTSVVCTDINPAAVQNILHNAWALGVADSLSAECCDVFPAPTLHKCFDVVFWNVPFIFRTAPTLDMLGRSVFDFNYGGLAKYVAGVQSCLSVSGRAYVGFSPTTGDLEQLGIVFARYGCCGKVIAKAELLDGFVLQLIELVFAS